MSGVAIGAPDACTPKGFRVCPLDAFVIRKPQAAGSLAGTGIRSFERPALGDAPHAATTSATPTVAAVRTRPSRLTPAQSARRHFRPPLSPEPGEDQKDETAPSDFHLRVVDLPGMASVPSDL
jgi:hypothetical protein